MKRRLSPIIVILVITAALLVETSGSDTSMQEWTVPTAVSGPTAVPRPFGCTGCREPQEAATRPPAPRPSPSRASRSRPSPKPVLRAASTTGGVTLSSTAYCLTGTMANGQRVYRGAVAGNRWPLGTRVAVSDSPYGPGVFTVADRIGHGSSLDFGMPGDCSGARKWGRRTITVRVVG